MSTEKPKPQAAPDEPPAAPPKSRPHPAAVASPSAPAAPPPIVAEPAARVKVTLSIEEVLMRELRFGGLNKENLKELVAIVAAIQKGGLQRLKVFPRGVPVPEGVRVSGMLDAGDMGRFFDEVLLKTPRLGGVSVFPYGIPLPESFRVNIDIGSVSQNEPVNQY